MNEAKVNRLNTETVRNPIQTNLSEKSFTFLSILDRRCKPSRINGIRAIAGSIRPYPPQKMKLIGINNEKLFLKGYMPSDK